jgi:dihydrofolate reductase
MRKIILFNMVTLDGFFAGPNGEIDWHNVDAEFNEFAIAQLNSADGLVFGRATYQMMASYWPTPTAIENDPVVANRMNSLLKIVVSRTLKSAEWNNSKLVKENVAEEISKLKQQAGKNLLLFGSADLASTWTRLGLIDEYRLMVNPVVLGKGSPMFRDIDQKLDLKLLNTKTFRSGNVLLYYEPVRK